MKLHLTILFCSLLGFCNELIGQDCPEVFEAKNQFCVVFSWASEPASLPDSLNNLLDGNGNYTLLGISSTSGSGDMPFVLFFSTGSSSCNANGYSGSAGQWYYEFTDGSSVSCLYDSDGSFAGILPIEFGEFTSTYNEVEEQVELSCDIYNQESISHFEIHRSENGVDFTVITTIVSEGDIENWKLQYIDNDIKGSTRFFYMIKAIEHSGIVNNSTIISVKVNSQLEVHIQDDQIYAENAGNVSKFIVYDLTGNVVKNISIDYNQTLQFSLDQFSSGLYIITAISNNGEVLKSLKYFKK